MTLQFYDLCAADEDLRFSPYCIRIRKALEHKELPFEAIPVQFAEIPELENGTIPKVPVLIDGDKRIAESFEIAEYLEEKYPDAPSLFGGEGGRAAAKFVAAWSASFHGFIGKIIVKDIHDMLDDENKAYFRKSREVRFGQTLEAVHSTREEAVPPFLHGLKSLELHLNQDDFLGGKTPNYADYIVFSMLKWPKLTSTLDFVPTDGPIGRWYQAIDER